MPDYDQTASAYLRMYQQKPVEKQGQDENVLTEQTEYLAEDMLFENRLAWLKQHTKDVSFAHDPHGPAKTIPDLVDKIATEGDPTHNKVHTQWLTNLYKQGAFKQEDLYKAHDTLKDYEGTPSSTNEKGEKVDGRKGVKHLMSPEEKQINHTKYPSIQSLQTAIGKHVAGGLPSNQISANLKKWQDAGRGGITQVHDDDHVRVYRLHSDEQGKEASKAIYGGGSKAGCTEWCTANHNDEHNYFHHYTKEEYPGSHLYVVHRKSDGEVFQYHTHSDQFMNKADEQISSEDLKSIQPSLHKMWERDPSTTD